MILDYNNYILLQDHYTTIISSSQLAGMPTTVDRSQIREYLSRIGNYLYKVSGLSFTLTTLDTIWTLAEKATASAGSTGESIIDSYDEIISTIAGSINGFNSGISSTNDLLNQLLSGNATNKKNNSSLFYIVVPLALIIVLFFFSRRS